MPTQVITTGQNAWYQRAQNSVWKTGYMEVGWRRAPNGTVGENTAYLQFDTSSLIGKRIISAYIDLNIGESFIGNGYVFTPLQVNVYGTDSDMNIADITTSNLPSQSRMYGGFSVYNRNQGSTSPTISGDMIKDYINGNLGGSIIILSGEKGSYEIEWGEIFGFGSAYRPTLTVEYELIAAKKPKNLTPNNTHVQRESSILVSWEYDPAWTGDTQQGFQLRYSQDGGTTFTTISEEVARTNYTFAYNQLTTGAVTWQVRVKNVNGLWSAWETASFTWSQVLPQRPQNLQPDGIRTAILPTASWVYTAFNEDDTPTAFNLQYSNDGGATYTDVTQTTSASNYAFPSSLRGGLIKWRVRVRSSYLQVFSNWSEYALFTYEIPPENPVITSPMSFSTPSPTITWTSPEQVAYELQVLNSGDNVIWQTGERNTTSKTYKIETFLENDSEYTIRLRIKNGVPLWSEWVEQVISVSFDQSDAPEIFVSEDTTKFGVHIRIRNPVSILQNEIWRRRSGELLWIRIAKDIPENGVHTDYTIEHDTYYEYRVRAMESESFADSIVERRKVCVTDSQLMSISDTGIYVPLAWNPSKSESTSIQQSIVSYVGRKYPAVIWGGNESKSLAIKFTIKKESLPALYQLYERRETLLFRDSRGRKQYVVITGEISVEDEIPFFELFNVSMRLTVVDHKEAV